MKKDERAVRLTASEFLANGSNGLNQQVANARWQLILALQRKVPEFFERLRDEVYPAFGRLAEPSWGKGAGFAMWQSRSDPDRQLTRVLMSWAQRFNVEREAWILEGALRTLSNWGKFARCRENLEIVGFRQLVCVPGLVWDHERAFHFEDDGWDPTLMSLAGWRISAFERFEATIEQHGHRMQALVKERGGVPAVTRSSEEHFDWLALYQCANVPLASIAQRAGYGDRSTISKGMHQAAKLARIHIRAKARKLKSYDVELFQLI
jgi:hypothetical protein